MSTEPLISVVIPVYNKEDKLKKCIDSVLKQSYSRFEIIIVNDGSTDNSRAVIDLISKNDSRIKAFHTSNKGVSSARNIGIDNATGEYICFIDSDDWIDENYLESLLGLSIKQNVDILIISAKVEVNEKIQINHFFSESGFIEKERAILQLFDASIGNETGNYIDAGVPWGKLYKLNFIRKNNLKFNIKLKRNQDNIFNLYAFQYAEGIYYERVPLYNYNYDNFGDFGIKYMKNGTEVFSEFAIESYKFYEKFYSEKDGYYDAIVKKLASTFMTILSRTIFNPKNPISHKERVYLAKTLANTFPFFLIFKVPNLDRISDKSNVKLVVSLVKQDKFDLLATIYKLKYFFRFIKK